ncbi:MAG: hypothetical protein HDQ87_08335 [Clostridia bacterium]|nr:hypothetical protein [Clostridia bacterium]
MAEMRRNWGDVFDDVERECRRENNNLRKECDRKVAQAQKAAAKAEAGRTMWREKHQDIKRENYALKTEIEKRDGQIARQKRLLNMNSWNSSIPSSKETLAGKPKPKHSARKSSGRKQGAQPGHKPQPRRDLPAIELWILQPQDDILKNSNFPHPEMSGMHLATASERCQIPLGASPIYAREYTLNTRGKLADEVL